MPPLTEKAFMAQVVQLARLRGFLVYHVHNSRRAPAGWPDLFMVRPARKRGDWSRVIAAELKVGKNKPTPAQEEWLAVLREVGVETHLWRPEQWSEIEKALE